MSAQNPAPKCRDGDPPLKELERHAWELGSLLRGFGFQKSTLGAGAAEIGEWLILAGGLEEVSLDTGRYDDSLMLCGQAADYEVARSGAVGEVQREFTRLLYAWGAYEGLQRAGSALFGEAADSATREWLAREWWGELPKHYSCAVEGTMHLVRQHPHYSDLARYLVPSENYPFVVLGLRVSGQIRHRLAHGRVVHPEPAGWGGTPRQDSLIARGGARLLLLSLQMLLSTMVVGEGLTEEFMDSEGEYHELPLEQAVMEVGLEVREV